MGTPKRPRLLLESHVPFVPTEINRFFDVEVLSPEEITPEAVKRFDAIIARTRTRAGATLLEGSPVTFFGTATIGRDHIDETWCAANGVEAASAPGCNAPAVAQYVFASLLTLFPDGLEGKTIGIVGVGHVGSIVADWAHQLGMRPLLCDPPRAEAEGPEGFVSLEQVAAESDIVTFHVPHTRGGDHPTHHLADEAFFSALKRGAVVVNAARGPIVDTPALAAAIDSGVVSQAVIDTWEGEPNISLELLERVAIATPHIAGYSIEGKVRAATAVAAALCRHFNVPFNPLPTYPLTTASTAHYPGSTASFSTSADDNTLAGSIIPYLPESVTAASICASYDPLVDDRIFRAAVDSDADLTSTFERLRNTYPLRPEVR